MTLNVGSMLVKAKFEAGNMMSGLGAMNSRFKESQLASKQATTQFGRMKGSLMAMGAAAALTGGSLLGMLMNAIMQSPFLAAAFEKLKVQMMLFGNAIARHLAPILEKVVNFVKWLREKFQALPEPIQAGIVKIIAFGIIAIGLISTLGLLIVGLGLVKTALVTLGIGSVITKFGALGTAIAGSTIATSLFAIGMGILSGLFGVWVLEKTGVLNWFENLGRKVDITNGKLRDFAYIIGGITGGALGGAFRDLAGGDFDFTHYNAIMDEMKRSKYRLKSGTSETGGYDRQTYESNLSYQSNLPKESMGFGGSWDAPKTEIGTQNVNITLDLSGVTGISTPEDLLNAANVLEQRLVENQELLNV